jgi:hypothetical protein
MQQILRHEPSSKGVFVREDAVGAGEEGRQQHERVEQTVEGGFAVELERRRQPLRLGEEGWRAVQQGCQDLVHPKKKNK